MSLVKRINVNDGSGRKFEDNTVGEIVLDVVPTVNSFNGVTSDAVARAVAGASGEVPQVTESDNGKVLKAVYDEGGPAVEWGTGSTVDQTYDAESTNAQSGVAVAEAIGTVNAVPASTSVDEGKVLTVDNAGSAAWATPEVPTIDQTYDATSTNAQSGVAVAEAVGGVLPSLTGNAGKVLAVNSGATGTEWVAAGGGADQPLPAVGTNVLRFEFEDGTFNPTNDAGCNFTGTSWAKVTEATTRNIWDCTLANDPSSSNCFKITEKCKVIDGLYSRPLSNLFSSRTIPAGVGAASTGLISVDIKLYGNSVYHKRADYAFSDCTKLKEVRFRSYYEMDFSSARSMFQMCYALESVTAQTVGSTGASVGVFIGGSTASTAYMFNFCKSLKSISGFSVDASVTSLDANYMFANCSVLSSVDSMFSAVGSSFSIGYAADMFSGCTKLVEIGSALKISATSIAWMFEGCASLERVALLDLNNVVTNATAAFRGCNSLAEVNIVNSGNVTDWSEAFSTRYYRDGDYIFSSNAPMLKLPSLDTSGATNVSHMFHGRKYADGALAMYQQLSQQANPPTSYNYCFTDCGSVTHASDLAQIPSSWGGTGT